MYTYVGKRHYSSYVVVTNMYGTHSMYVVE